MWSVSSSLAGLVHMKRSQLLWMSPVNPGANAIFSFLEAWIFPEGLVACPKHNMTEKKRQTLRVGAVRACHRSSLFWCFAKPWSIDPFLQETSKASTRSTPVASSKDTNNAQFERQGALWLLLAVDNVSTHYWPAVALLCPGPGVSALPSSAVHAIVLHS